MDKSLGKRRRIAELQVVQRRILAVARQQFGMGTALDDMTLVEHDNLIGVFDGRQAMRDHDRGAILHQPRQRILDQALGFRIQRAGGFVQHQDRRILQKCAGHRDALALATRKQRTALAHPAVDAVGQFADEFHRVGGFGRGDIEFREVHLTYAGASAAALRGISLTCPRGSITALVGRSGSGKSSLASLIPRFYEPTSGEVLLDGHPLGDYTLRSLRAQIAWVGQDVVLFDDTIAKNIAYGALANVVESDIVAAAEAANAMEFIRELPDGIHSRVGEGGSLLSGGQRQRIAVARALLKDAPILVLDEATSALDTESERLIQDALSRLMKNRTTIVIAHRLSTVEHADQIVVLDQGHVAERGTHAELLARNGKYAALHHLQFREAAIEAP